MKHLIKDITLMLGVILMLFGFSMCEDRPSALIDDHPQMKYRDTAITLIKQFQTLDDIANHLAGSQDSALIMARALTIAPGEAWTWITDPDSLISKGFAILSQNKYNRTEWVVTDTAMRGFISIVANDSIALSMSISNDSLIINDSSILLTAYRDTLNLSNDTLYISGNNYVLLSSYLDNTDAQTLAATLIGDSLTVSGGNSILLPHRLYGIDSLAEIYTKSFPLGAMIINRSNTALYKVQSAGVTGYTTDSIAVIPTGSRYAALQPQNGFINPIHLGAIANDGTTDQPAIQKAMNYAAKQDWGVSIDDGLYLLDTFLYLQSDSFFTIQGNGKLKYMDNVIRGTGNTSNAILFFDQVDHLTIQGLTLDANAGNRPTDSTDVPAHNIRARGCDHLVIRDIKIPSSVGDGITIAKYNTDVPTDVTIDNVQIDQYFRSGISLINGNNVRIINSTFRDPQSGALGGGINVEPNTGETGTINGVKIINCTFRDSLQYGIQVTERAERDTKEVSIEGCDFVTIGVGVTATAGFQIFNSYFRDIYSTATSDNAIDVRGDPGTSSPELQVVNCIFKDIQSRACYADGDTRRVEFNNNIIQNCGRGSVAPVLNLYSDTAIVINNSFTDNYWGAGFYDNVVVRCINNTFEYHDKYSIYLNNSDHSTIKDNYIHNSSRVSFTSKGYLYMSNLSATYTLVDGNHFDGESGFTAIEVDQAVGEQMFTNNIFNDFTNTIRFDAGYNATAYVGMNYINGVTTIGLWSSAPGSPQEGMIYGDSSDNHLYYYNGSTWVQLDN